MNKILVLDTTLRDGAQGEGVIFSLEDKIKVIRALDDLGVDYIEAGNPASNPKDAQLFKYAKSGLALKNSTLVAFGSTCRVNSSALNDEGLSALVESGCGVASIFGKSSRYHVERVLMCTPEENLRIISESIAFLVSRGIRVFFDAEHFFDGWLYDADYAVATLIAARDAGAESLVLCDTNGGALISTISAGVSAAIQKTGAHIGIHCHDDAGLAIAASMAAVEAGANFIQGTINGYGERCGNANLCTLIPNIAFKLKRQCLDPEKIRLLTPTARLISDIANLSMNERAPYVGRSAFSHKGGMHVDGMLKNASTYEHIDPEAVGNRRRYLVSEMAGRTALMTRLSTIAPDLEKNSPDTIRIIDMLKELEREGYSFEGADGSLKLRVLGALGKRRVFFQVRDFHVISRLPDDNINAQAYVKVLVNDQVEITADEGDGPVNAIDLALRKALSRFYPTLASMRLKDFKVRVVSGIGTASKVRVHIESTNGKNVWATVGVSNNIIEASLIALTDSIEYMLSESL
ncbi:MAG: citramalate synthase [Clostridia bacterium]|nr:citramalate synthase [Clostridia bacterium]